jgi:hypothetical protein
MKPFIPVLTVLVISAGCTQVQNSHFPEVQDNRKDITIHQIDMDTLLLPEILCSYLGYIQTNRDSIYYTDSKFCWVFSFGKDGSVGTRHLGRGAGPSELPTGKIAGSVFLDSCRHFFVGMSHDCYIYDRHYRMDKRYRIDIGRPDYNLTYDNPVSYMLNYGELVMRYFNGYLYYTAHTEKEGLWYYENPEESIANEHIIAKMNIHNGKLEELLGWVSPFYTPSKHIFHLATPYFDIDKQGHFHITYALDPLIYTYDKDFSPLTAFGYEGKRMNKKYSSSAVENDYRTAWLADKAKCGYYTGLEYIDEIGMLLRTYTRGEKEPCDGLQIYRNETLIGDVDIPKGMTVIGYIEPFVYGAAINEDNEEINVYRFALTK